MIKELNGYREIVEYDSQIQVSMYQNKNTESFPPHIHSAYEIIMPFENDYRVKIKDTTIHLLPNDILIIAPEILHSLIPPEHGKRYMLLVNPSVLSDLPEYKSFAESIYPYAHFSFPHDPAQKDFFANLIHEIWFAYSSTKDFKYFLLYARLYEFFGNAARYWKTANISQNTPIEYNNNSRLEQFTNICRFINEHYNESLTAEYLSDILGLSVSHFNKLFKFYSGISFTQYLTKRRLTAAKDLLKTSANNNIIDIALQCGFSSVSSFNRIFKNLTGYTPSEYRKNFQKDV